jgi:hypothetical protein
MTEHFIVERGPVSQGKRPIDAKRDSAFRFELAGDGGPIRDTFAIGKKLYAFRDHSIYSVMLADQIDPNRTNPNLGHVQQLEYEVGYMSPVVGRTILTAKYLFRDGMLDSRFGKDELLILSLEYFEEVLALSKMHKELLAELHSAADKWNLSQRDHSGSVFIPSISDLKGKLKAFIQRAEHSAQRLLAISKIFFPLTTKAGFDSIVEAVKSKQGVQDYQIAFAEGISKFLKFLRNCRHCIEHPHPHQNLKITNFELAPDGRVAWPSIEVLHKDTPEPEIAVPTFVDFMLNSVLNLGEHHMALLASLHVQPGWNHAFVSDFPTERRRHPHVRYYFAFNMNGEIHPVG